MRQTLKKYGALLTMLGAAFFPILASAHEVYVLDAATAARDMAMVSPNPFSAYIGNESNFFFWGFVSIVTVLTILSASAFHLFEQRLNSLFFRLKKYAHPLVRATVGVCLVAFGIYGNIFGSELFLAEIFGALSGFMQAVFVVSGIGMMLGFYTRAIALLMLGIYASAAFVLGGYILTYTDYLGAFILLLILGSGKWSLDHFLGLARLPHGLQHLAHRLEKFAFPTMRVFFGFGVMFAAIYAKYIHSQLALDVVNQYTLTNYFQFDPLFVVLGALIIEFIAGLMMLLGVEIRWTALFLVFWLTLSLLYFEEAVWPHIILFGLGFAILCHGYDEYSLEGRILKKAGVEPLL